MPSPTFLRVIATAGTLGVAALSLLAAPVRADKAAAVQVLRPEKGFVDDAYALTVDGRVFLYVNTDGANWATLRAVGLPGRDGAAAAPASPAAPSAEADKKSPAAASKGKAAVAAGPPFTVAPGSSQELVANLPLSTFKMYLLPDDRVLIVSRDTETGGSVNGTVYSLRSRGAVPIGTGASLGPASDITVGETPSGPAIVAITRPTERANEYRVQTVSTATLKPLAQKIYKVREGEPRVATEKGSAMPLYFLDDYLTLVAKHDGFYDKKRDVRQPDFLAFIDAPTGKLTRSRPIADPVGLLELSRLRTGHGESAVVLHDPEGQRFELLLAQERGQADGPVESRTALTLPRSAGTYDPLTLLYKVARPGLLIMSLTVDPVNEKAVAARRTDPDTLDLCAVELTAGGAGPVQRLLMLPGNQRPSSWTVTPGGRLALLRKHKGFSRGGTEVEIYDLDLPPVSGK